MAGISPLSGSSTTVSASKSVSIGLRPGLASTSATSDKAQAGKALNAKQGAEAVTKGITASTDQFATLSGLQEKLAGATKPGAELSKADLAAINKQIQEVVAKIDKQAAGAKVGDTNLLAKNPGGVTVTTESGTKVNIATQAQDSKALGLADKNGKALEVTDAESLRKAVGKIAQAVGQTQLTTFRLQTADGVTGAPAPANAGLEAFDKIRSSEKATPEAGSAQASVQKALDNLNAANASGYGRSGKAKTSTPSVLSLLT
jgi:hypothetical protein